MRTKIKHNRLRPIEDVDQLDKSIVVRYNKNDLNKRVEFILELETCQVCETSRDLDYPHHAVYGSGKKDDRYLINICVACHRIIHSGSYFDLLKTREEVAEIGWENHLAYREKIKEL